VPLSVLELFDRYGYSNIISSMKELVELGRIEIVGTAAYHPLLTKIHPSFAEQQIILQEFALGYYLGRRKGFDGDNTVMYKDLKGFFPPELAINRELLSTLSDLGYEWCLVDECSVLPVLPTTSDLGSKVFAVNNLHTRVVVRDTKLSNLLSFKRNTTVSDLIEYMTSHQNKEFVIGLDAEYFGHHYKQRLYVLDFLYQEFERLGGVFATVTDIVEDYEASQIPNIFESSWGATSSDVVSGNPYPLWSADENIIQSYLWELSKMSQDLNLNFFKHSFTDEDLQNVPVWSEGSLARMVDVVGKSLIEKNILVNKSLHSDQYWWSSGLSVGGTYLYSSDMINKALNLYNLVFEENTAAQDLITKIRSKL